MHSRADAPKSNPTCTILNFFSLKLKRLRLLWTEISRDREISCKKSEMSFEGHWEEHVSLADGNKWRGKLWPRADKGWEHLSALSSPSALGEHWNEAEINTFCNHDSWQDANESEQPQKHGGGRCRWSGRTADKYSFCFGKYNNRPQQKRAHTSSTWRAKFTTVRGKFYCNFYKGNLSSLSTARLLSQTTANKWVVEDDQIVFDGSSLSELK